MASANLEVVFIEYGTEPTLMIESPKQVWATLKFPAPRTLLIGSKVRLHVAPGIGVNTQGERSPLSSVFTVTDVVGYRVALEPVGVTDVAPYTRGFDRRVVNVRPMRQNWHYGYGDANAFLEYHPQSP